MMKASETCLYHEDFLCYPLRMATSIDQSDYMKTALRLPRDLHAWLMEFAAAQDVSLNAVIVQVLDEKRGKLPIVEIGEKSLDAIEARLRHALKHK
ncbi:toxin-antitoxin system HicB family antitoxin [Paraburkholderia sp. WC7.3g]|uniref:toxin-antitoxin system HicB family antitoxin n=1 Tax=Paraburkholderia sp. WC7.3g TaxID=2991070 RepID=UPI003D1E8BB9